VYWLYTFIELLFNILIYAIIARALLSWFIPRNSGNRLMMVLDEITEPVIAPIRRVMPRIGMLDLSPLVAIIVLQVVQYLLLSAMRASI
jgi:YggT family protein